MNTVKSWVQSLSKLPRARAILFYACVFFLTLFALQLITHAFSANFRTPFRPYPNETWGGDLLPLFFQFKAILAGDFGPFTPIGSERLGFPFVANWNDYPTNHSLFFAIIKLLGVFSSDWAVVMNVYWILTFPLAAMSAAFLFRRLKIKGVINVALSLLFTFVPYHFYRHGHIWLASYFLVPLQLYIVLTLFRRRLLFFPRVKRFAVTRRSAFLRAKIGVLLVLILAGWAGVYYAAFFCIFAAFAGLAAALRYNSLRHAGVAAFFIGITFASVLADSIPFLKQQAALGRNPMATARARSDVETFGLKPIQLLLPIVHHRVPLVSKLVTTYAQRSPLTNENQVSALGAVGAAGFLFLLLFPLIRMRMISRHLSDLSQLAYVGLLTGTIGGIGAILGYSVFGSLRCYNRVSIFISAISLLAVGTVLSRIVKGRKARWALAVAISVLGIADQTSANWRYDGKYVEIPKDKNFYNEVETKVGATAVYQLPAFTMPEWNSYGTLPYYDPFKGYIFTERTKWAFGNFNGRFENALIQNIAYQDAEDMIHELATLKFSHVLVAGNGYTDKGLRINASIQKILGNPVLSDKENKLNLYSLADRVKPGAAKTVPRKIAYSFVTFTRAEVSSTDSIGRHIKITGHWEMEAYNKDTAPRMVRISYSCAGDDISACGQQIWGTKHGAAVSSERKGNSVQVSFSARPGTTRLGIELPEGARAFILQDFHVADLAR